MLGRGRQCQPGRRGQQELRGRGMKMQVLLKVDCRQRRVLCRHGKRKWHVEREVGWGEGEGEGHRPLDRDGVSIPHFDDAVHWDRHVNDTFHWDRHLNGHGHRTIHNHRFFHICR